VNSVLILARKKNFRTRDEGQGEDHLWRTKKQGLKDRRNGRIQLGDNLGLEKKGNSLADNKLQIALLNQHMTPRAKIVRTTPKGKSDRRSKETTPSLRGEKKKKKIMHVPPPKKGKRPAAAWGKTSYTRSAETITGSGQNGPPRKGKTAWPWGYEDFLDQKFKEQERGAKKGERFFSAARPHGRCEGSASRFFERIRGSGRLNHVRKDKRQAQVRGQTKKGQGGKGPAPKKGKTFRFRKRRGGKTNKKGEKKKKQ